MGNADAPSYLSAGLVFAGAALITVTPIEPVAQSGAASPDVQLTAGELTDLSGLMNVPQNLFNDIANIPYDLFQAPYSISGLVPQFAVPGQDVTPGFDYPDIPTNPDVTTDPITDGISHGAINNLANALLYTGSWWQSSPTNVWGWDTANPWNSTALINFLVPMQPMGEPLADNLNNYMAAEFPIATPENKFFFNDLPGELQSLFKVPTSQLESGFTFGSGDPSSNPPVINPVGIGAGPLGNGGTTYPEIWNGTTTHLDPSSGLGMGQTQAWSGDEVNNFFTSLLQDPAQNPIHPLDPSTIVPSLWNLYNSFNTDFSPLYLGANPATDELVPATNSFFFSAAKDIYGIPNLLNGIFGGDVFPQSLTNELGSALNQSVGPDSAFAQTLTSASNSVMQLVNQLELSLGGPGVPGFNDAADLGSAAAPDLAASAGAAPDALSSLDLPF